MDGTSGVPSERAGTWTTAPQDSHSGAHACVFACVCVWWGLGNSQDVCDSWVCKWAGLDNRRLAGLALRAYVSDPVLSPVQELTPGSFSQLHMLSFIFPV